MWLICIIISCPSVCSQSHHYKVGVLNDNNSITENVVSSIVKDSLGFIWIGKMDGLYRYNGYEAKVFAASPTDDGTGLSNPWVTALLNYQHFLVIGTKRGVNLYNKRDDSFDYVFPAETSKDIGNDITSLAKIGEANLLIGTSNGLLNYKYTQGKIYLNEIPLKDNEGQVKGSSIKDIVTSETKGFVNADTGFYTIDANASFSKKVSYILKAYR